EATGARRPKPLPGEGEVRAMDRPAPGPRRVDVGRQVNVDARKAHEWKRGVAVRALHGRAVADHGKRVVMFALTRHAADEGEREVVLQEQLQLVCAAALRGERGSRSRVCWDCSEG